MNLPVRLLMPLAEDLQERSGDSGSQLSALGLSVP